MPLLDSNSWEMTGNDRSEGIMCSKCPQPNSDIAHHCPPLKPEATRAPIWGFLTNASCAAWQYFKSTYTWFTKPFAFPVITIRDKVFCEKIPHQELAS